MAYRREESKIESKDAEDAVKWTGYATHDSWSRYNIVDDDVENETKAFDNER